MALKEVHFGDYCPTCIHYDLNEDEDPCNDCLNNPSNENSHKPVRWKKDTKKRRLNP